MRVEIITSIGYEVWSRTHLPTSADYNHVCNRLISKFPHLADPMLAFLMKVYEVWSRTHLPTSADYNHVCNRLISKFPHLADPMLAFLMKVLHV